MPVAKERVLLLVVDLGEVARVVLNDVFQHHLVVMVIVGVAEKEEVPPVAVDSKSGEGLDEIVALVGGEALELLNEDLGLLATMVSAVKEGDEVGEEVLDERDGTGLDVILGAAKMLLGHGVRDGLELLDELLGDGGLGLAKDDANGALGNTETEEGKDLADLGEGDRGSVGNLQEK